MQHANNPNGYEYLGSLVSAKTNNTITPECNFGEGIIKCNEVMYFEKDHLGSTRAVLNISGSVLEKNDYYPLGLRHANSSYVITANNRYKFNGKEEQKVGSLGVLDYGARMYDGYIGRWLTIDPIAEKYYSTSPYAYCANNPMRFIDPTGMAWRPTYDEDHDENRTYNGYEWVDEDKSYNNKDGTLKSGLYAQAIFFSDNGTFDADSKYNMGSSTATVYLADGTTQAFDANTNPSSSDYATVPEGVYHATVGSHKGQYTALRMSDTNNSGQIELGTPNPAHPERTYAEGVNIHKPGDNNLTGLTRSGNSVSAGCLLIDGNKWSGFIGSFNNSAQKGNTVSVTVSRTFASPVNANRLPAFNFRICFEFIPKVF